MLKQIQRKLLIKEIKMKKKSILLTIGASLSLGLATAAHADQSSSFQTEKLNYGYNNVEGSFKLAEGKCGAGKCGANKSMSSDSTNKKSDGSCGADKDKKSDGSCGADKKSDDAQATDDASDDDKSAE